ncbi:MAG TPA: ribose-5-phosphate isomerase RpiA [Burkholderiaceae bacterium]|nr:ribose-5-phosphate isomerase RpiA [Burkholderiaceae bacterium]
MNQDELKLAAARAALDYVDDGAVIGVGSGSTVNFFIEALGGIAHRVAGAVSSSERSSERLRAAGIEVFELNDVVAADRPIPLYVDGADEINVGLEMIKGGGGALTREKIVADAAARFVCIVDQSKCVETLGRFPLPIEVIPMARASIIRRCERIGGLAQPRAGFVSDNGNPILDVAGLTIRDARALETEISTWPGVVTVGLFALRPADIVVVASPKGVQRVSRPERRPAAGTGAT